MLLLCSLKIQAQNPKTIDSLESLFNHTTGLKQFDAAYDLGFEYFFKGDIHKALNVFEKAQAIAYNKGDSLRIVKSVRVRFQMLRRLDRANEGINDLLTVLPISKRNDFKDENKYILNLLAIYYTLQANYDKALEYHFQALLLREQDGEHAAICETLNNIGIVYFKLSNYPKAIEFYNLALEHDYKVEKSKFRAQLLINLGLCFNQIKNFDDARKLITQGMNYCSPDCDENIIITGELGLGMSYLGQKLFSGAQSHFRKSLAIAQKNDNIRFQAENFISLAHTYVFTEEYDSALYCLANTERIANEKGYNELLIESYKEYSNLFTLQQDFENASFYQKKYITLKDSIYSGELIDKISNINL